MRGLALGLLLLGCTKAPPAAPASQPASAPASAPADPMARVKQAGMTLGRALQDKLLVELAKGGPGGAVEACASEAQAITKKVAEETGVRVGRASLRLRNEANAGPDWVRSWLEAQGERTATGLEPLLTKTATAARFLKPIEISGVCLPCHGAELDPSVAQVLGERYPNDAARAYDVGALRGALWAELPLQ